MEKITSFSILHIRYNIMRNLRFFEIKYSLPFSYIFKVKFQITKLTAFANILI